MNQKQYPYFVSWSGGKDSCLALHRAVDKFGQPKVLLTMLTEEGQRSRSHGLHKSILQAQADSLGVDIRFYSTTWDHYEDTFISALHALKKDGIMGGVFGDMKIAHHPDWVAHCKWAERVCAQANMVAHEPLWHDRQDQLIADFLMSRIDAKIIAVKNTCLDIKYLGQSLTAQRIDEFMELGIHPLGETGEFHTVVVDSPLFSRPLSLVHKEQVLKDSYWFLNVEIEENPDLPYNAIKGILLGLEDVKLGNVQEYDSDSL